MKNHIQNNTYSRAKYKVDKIKKFYKHLAAFIIVNSFSLSIKIVRNLNNGESFSEAFFDISFNGILIFWGIGLAFHAFSVFGIDSVLGKNWEENKIDQFMEEDQYNINSNRK